MKDPVGVLGCRRGFSCLESIAAAQRQPCNQNVSAHRLVQEPIACLWTYLSLGCFPREGPMPAWLEVLLNVIGFAGFIGIAKYHKAPGGKSPDR